MPQRKRRLSKQDLRDLGATPSLMHRRVGPDGRARLEQLAPESPQRRREAFGQDFARRLTSDSKLSEGSKTA
jgi:hypothetical protein